MYIPDFAFWTFTHWSFPGATLVSMLVEEACPAHKAIRVKEAQQDDSFIITTMIITTTLW